MTDPEYLFRQTEIERKKLGYGDKHKKRGGGKTVRFPSDYLSKKERDAMNGEIKTYKQKEFYNWEEFKALPDDLQLKWVNSIINRYGCSVGAICTIVFGKTRTMLSLYMDRKGLTKYINKGPMGRKAGREAMDKLAQAFKAWNDTQVTCYDPNIITEAPNDEVDSQNDEVEKNVVEETPEPPKNVTGKADLHNIALLLQNLAGTGAKLTIEVTL